DTYLIRCDLTLVEHRHVWKQWIPGLAGSDALAHLRNRREIVALGLPAVKHLVTALDARTLLPALKDNQSLAPLRPIIEADLIEWYTMHADKLKGLSSINTLMAAFRQVSTGEEIIAGVRAFYDTMNRNKEDVPRPQVLNSLRAQAALAIGEIGDRTAGPQVARMLDDYSIECVGYAIESLGRLQAPIEGWRAVFRFAYHESSWLRSKVWGALRRMDARPAIDQLLADIPRSNGSQGRKILEGLEAITMQTHGEDLGAWTRWWNRERDTKNPLDIERPRTQPARG
ncbi:MAG: HEAT repeat domain-containing protein, partial [Planctomycetota bacterium]